MVLLNTIADRDVNHEFGDRLAGAGAGCVSGKV